MLVVQSQGRSSRLLHWGQRSSCHPPQGSEALLLPSTGRKERDVLPARQRTRRATDWLEALVCPWLETQREGRRFTEVLVSLTEGVCVLYLHRRLRMTACPASGEEELWVFFLHCESFVLLHSAREGGSEAAVLVIVTEGEEYRGHKDVLLASFSCTRTTAPRLPPPVFLLSLIITPCVLRLPCSVAAVPLLLLLLVP